MARMIDADRLLRELTALSHGQVWPGWTYDGIRLLIERQPTLTQPNESATDTNVGGKDNDVSTNAPVCPVLCCYVDGRPEYEKEEALKDGKDCSI